MPLRSDARVVGYLAVSVAALLYGLWANLSKLAEQSVPPLTIALWSQVLPGLLYFPSFARHRLPRKDVPLLVLVSCAGAVAAPVVYYFGLVGTTAANASLLSNSESVFTVVIAFTFLGERLTRRGYLALAGIVFGAFTVTTQLEVGNLAAVQYLPGNLLLILGTFFWGVDNNGSTVLSRRSRIVPMISAKLLLGSALLVPVLLVTGAPLLPSGPDAWLILVIAFGGELVAEVLFYHALRVIGAIRAGSILSASALWGVLISLALFPGEPLTATQLAGGALMILATIALYVFGGTVTSASAGAGETLKPAGPDGPKLP
ncbi:MAG TPA: DMT family transporter [Thermoplasmata archaeon]|nr:DMT family transporter [Thermoplasmata archaeon]